jgi:polyhydroxyalkanoate synthesis regulator phasin
MELLESVKRLMLAGIGVPEKLKEVVDDLVKRGELSESQGAKLFKEWTERAEKGTADMSKAVSEAVGKTLEKMNIPTRDDLEDLQKKVKSLEKKVKELGK